MSAPKDDASARTADLETLHRLTLNHMLAAMQAPPGSINAAMMEAARKFLADQGVNAQTLADISRLDPARQHADLRETLKDYDGDGDEQPS